MVYLGVGGAVKAEEDDHSLFVHSLRVLQLTL